MFHRARRILTSLTFSIQFAFGGDMIWHHYAFGREHPGMITCKADLKKNASGPHRWFAHPCIDSLCIYVMVHGLSVQNVLYLEGLPKFGLALDPSQLVQDFVYQPYKSVHKPKSTAVCREQVYFNPSQCVTIIPQTKKNPQHFNQNEWSLMIFQWVTCFCLPPKKNIDQKTTTNRLTSVPTSNRLPRWVAWSPLVRFRPWCRGIMRNSLTKIVAGSNLSNLAPLADYLNEPVTRKKNLMYELCFFSGTWKCFCVGLMHVLRNYWKIVFLDHTCFEAPPKWNTFQCFQSVPWPHDLNISSSLQLLIHGKRLESNIALKRVISNPNSWVVTPVLVMPTSPRDLYWQSGSIRTRQRGAHVRSFQRSFCLFGVEPRY